MKKFRNTGIVFLIINLCILIYINFTITSDGSTVMNGETYDFNDNWIVRTSDYSDGETVSLPYKGVNVKNLGQDESDSASEAGTASTKAYFSTSDFETQQATLSVAGSDNGIQDTTLSQGVLPYGGADSSSTLENHIVMLENTIPIEYAGLVMTFTTNDSHFRVTIDGEVVYDGGYNTTSVINYNKGSVTNIINIPSNMTDGQIQIEFSQSNGIIEIGKMTVTKKDTAVLKMLKNNLFNIACSMTMLVASIVLILLMAIQKISKQSTYGMLYLCLLSADAAIYYTIQTQVISVIISKQTMMDELAGMTLFMFPYLLLMYYEKVFTDMHRKQYEIALYIACISIVFQLLIRVINIMSLQDLSIVNHGLIVAALVLVLVSLGCSRKREKSDNVERRIGVLAVMFLLTGECIDCIRVYILGIGNQGIFSRFGMTLFAVIMLLSNIRKVSGGYLYMVLENQRILKREVINMEEQNKKLLQANEEAEEARKEANAANEAKGRFLANMSHEIRTPINAVLGMDEMILRESKEENVKGYAMDIHTAGNSLLSLVNDILDFSKIESGKMEIIPIEYDFSSMIHDLVNMISVRADAKNLQLILEIDETIPSRLYGDDSRIRQVITNILTNAVKYTPSGSVTFKANMISKEDNKVKLHFEVKDTGIGIKEEDISKLFVEFERIEEKRNRNIEGTGLGMNITTQLLALMDSRLEVNSVYGEGSTFEFDIIQDIVEEAPIGNLEQRIKDQAANYSYTVGFVAPEAHLLVVDDNAVNRKVFRNLLKETLTQVEEAGSGKETLELVKNNHYDIVFLDHMMPDMDGIETLKNMRMMEDYPCRNTPVIALTANAISGAKEMYLAAGFDDFLSKPIIPEKLEKMIMSKLPENLVITGAEAERLLQESGVIDDNDNNNMSGGVSNAALTMPDGSEWPEVDGVDWRGGLVHMGKMSLLLDTAADFARTNISEAEALEDFYAAKDFDNYRIRVHAMKAAAAMIGAMPVSGMAKILEYASRDGDTDTVDKLHDIFIREWKALGERLNFLRKDDENVKEKSQADSETVRSMLDELRAAVDAFDIDKVDEVESRIEDFDYADDIRADMESLSILVKNIDYEKILEVIDRIKEGL